MCHAATSLPQGLYNPTFNSFLTDVHSPTVSVVLPTRNRVDFLRDAVESVREQTFTDLECIVVDGGSTDGTRGYLESLDDERVRVRRHEEPAGVSAARNAAIEMANGDYLVFLDDDDRLFETAIEVLVRTIEDQDEGCGGVYTAHRRRYESGEFREQRVSEGLIESYEEAAIGGPSCTIVPATVLADVGPFDESFPACEDTDFWIRLFAEYSMVAIDEILYERGYHDGQITQDMDVMIRGNELLLEKHAGELSERTRAGRRSAIFRMKNTAVENPW